MDSSNQIYHSPKNLSYFVIGGLALVALCEFLTAALGFGQIMNPAATVNLDESEVESVWLLLQGLTMLLKLPAFIFTVVLFLMWIHRANKNLTPLRAHNIQYSPSWAIGWWFIPFANLVKPFQVVSEVWTESDPDFDPDLNFLSNSIGTPNLLYFWWFFWIVSNIASNASSRMFDVDAASMEVSGYFFVASGILTVIAAILAIIVVRGITQRQETRSQKLGNIQQFTPPPPPDFN